MIRTLIEITGDDEWRHAQDLKATMDKLGYQPKDSADHVRYMGDLWQALQERGLEPQKLVEEFRAKLQEGRK